MSKIQPRFRVNDFRNNIQEDEHILSDDKDYKYKRPMIQIPFQQVFNKIRNGEQIGMGYLDKHLMRTLRNIALCKTIEGGYTVYGCMNCEHTFHRYNKCKDRNCPICNNLKTELWVDNQQADLVDAPYYHLVITLPHELNNLVKENKKRLYSLLLKAASETVIELSIDPKYLGGTPGITEVLHTWDQKLNYHVHCHAIVTGLGLTKNNEIVYNKKDDFFIPCKVLSDKFRGKFIDGLKRLYKKGLLIIDGTPSIKYNSYSWKEYIDKLYSVRWVSFVKETFNGKGNAIEYLGRYTNKVAIGNSRIVSVTDNEVTFTYRGETGKQTEQMTLSNVEFVKRFLQHVLPSGFQKIRFYGFLASGIRRKKLEIIFEKIKMTPRKRKYKSKTEAEVLLVKYNINVTKCPICGEEDSIEPMYDEPGAFNLINFPKEEREKFFDFIIKLKMDILPTYT